MKKSFIKKFEIPKKYHRRSIRLKGYDYSQAGFYFITICTRYRRHMFGEINNGEMIINDAGLMIEKWWNKLVSKYINIELHEKIVMPNHFHAILQITNKIPTPVGADPRVCPIATRNKNIGGEHIGGEHIGGEHIGGEHVGSPLHAMVQWFKTMSTNEYIHNVKRNDWCRFDKKLWQRGYYEHVIRDDNTLCQISKYIQMNPAKWKTDRFWEQSS